MNHVYSLYIKPDDAEPWLTVDERDVARTPTGKPATIDIRYMGDEGEVLLRFRPLSPVSYKAYLIAMRSDYVDGYLAKHARSL